METSLMLARLIGPPIVVMGLWVLLRPAQLALMAQGVLDSPALMFMAGLLALVAGWAIVLAHNIWVADWPVLITGFGWIAVLAGLARIFLPETMLRTGTAMLEHRALLVVPGLAMLALGAYLSWQGFAA